MDYNFSTKNKISFLIISLIFLYLLNPVKTQAYIMPDISLEYLKINGIEGGKINGEFSIKNNEDYFMNNLNYEIELLQGPSLEKLEMIDTKIPEPAFFVGPHETIIKNISYSYPKNINSGDYTIIVRILTDKGGTSGWKDEKIFLQGENKFMDMVNETAKVLIADNEGYPLQGIKANPGEKVVTSMDVKNLQEKIIVVPNIKIYKRQTNMLVVSEYQDEPIVFNKEETKTINLTMPELNTPESYLAEVKLLSNNEQVSGIQYFRWVVRGDGAKILNIKIDKDSYKAGENLDLTAEFIGPADASDAGVGEISIIISNKSGKIIAETTEKINLTSYVTSLPISIPINENIISPIIKLKITKEEILLDETNIKMPIFSEDAKDLKKETDKKTFLVYLFFYSLAIFLIILSSILIYKFKFFSKK